MVATSKCLLTLFVIFLRSVSKVLFIIVAFLENAPIEYSSESLCVSVCVCVCVCVCVLAR